MTKEPLSGMIGLEIHTYLVTKEKLFCECIASRERGLKPNVNICPICTGQPGCKPMLPNGTAVEKGVQIGLMLGCKINNVMPWYRKHYNWPDLPKGYQTTLSGSYAFPLGVKGKFAGIGIWSMHLEEDPASWEPSSGKVDYNRSGLPLVEIVTAPDFTTAEEVIAWLKKLVHSLAYLKAADSNAGIKVDVNVSIPNKTERVEIKNLNSLENIERAINYELERQAKEGSEKETRRFDDTKGKTVKMRSKEGAEDYRFMSDPDLQPLVLDDAFVEKIRKTLPEMPEEKLEKFIKKHKIDAKNAEILAKNIDIAEFFEKVAEKIDANFALPWITIELLKLLNQNQKKFEEVDIKPEHFIALLKLVKDEKITVLQGKQILNKFYPKSFAPENIEEKISDKTELKKIISQVLDKNPKAVESYKAGEKKSFDFLMGEIMKATNRRADFRIAREVLSELLA
jgi:aspartyl-tRNA(Asn)/glutamyl-tRNA(Gln) amidotransferase subunit B